MTMLVQHCRPMVMISSLCLGQACNIQDFERVTSITDGVRSWGAQFFDVAHFTEGNLAPDIWLPDKSQHRQQCMAIPAC
jgi:hypothetical protein